MNILIWITIAFITIGFVVLASMKKRMESKLASIKANGESQESSAKARSIIWWIGGTTAWGVVSMFLIVMSFQSYLG